MTPKKTHVNYVYGLETGRLTRAYSEKDLGVTTTCNSFGLSWDLHVNSIILKANKMLGVFEKNLHTTNRHEILKYRRSLYLHVSLKAAVIWYATEVWSPVNSIHLSKWVERIQRGVTIRDRS